MELDTGSDEAFALSFEIFNVVCSDLDKWICLSDQSVQLGLVVGADSPFDTVMSA